MKKTITVNLGGRAFQISEEAYTRLDDYLSSIAACFKHHECGDEITADIEDRISELCSEQLQANNSPIIDIALVNTIITRVGNPEAMMGDEEPAADDAGEAKESDKKGETTTPKETLTKKYYIDCNDRMVGGVISGLAAYLKADVTLLRVIALVALLATGIPGLVIYLVVWCIAPQAQNTTDRLRMQGIEPTPEEIARKITNEEPQTATQESKKDEAKEQQTKKWLLAAVIVLAILLLGPRVRVTGNNTALYIGGFFTTATITLAAILIANKITNILGERAKKIITTALVVTGIVTLAIAIFLFFTII